MTETNKSLEKRRMKMLVLRLKNLLENLLEPKIYSFSVNDDNEHKKEKGVNRSVVATISHNNKDKPLSTKTLLTNKCIRH